MNCWGELLNNERAFNALCDLKHTIMQYDRLEDFYTAFSDTVQPHFIAKDSNRWLIFALFFVLHASKSKDIINDKIWLLENKERSMIIEIIEEMSAGRTTMPIPTKDKRTQPKTQWQQNQEKQI